MNALARGIEQARTAVDRSAAAQVLPDLCDITELGLVFDGHSGQTEGETTVATDIPVEVSEAAPSSNTVVAGGVTYTGSHRLKFGWNAVTVAINPEQKITVHARGLESAMVFEQPVREKGSTGVWVFVLAKLTRGFRSPSNV